MAKLTMANMDDETDMAKWTEWQGDYRHVEFPISCTNWLAQKLITITVIDLQIHYLLTDLTHEAFSTRGSGMSQCRPKGLRVYAKRRELQHYYVHDFDPLL